MFYASGIAFNSSCLSDYQLLWNHSQGPNKDTQESLAPKVTLHTHKDTRESLAQTVNDFCRKIILLNPGIIKIEKTDYSKAILKSGEGGGREFCDREFSEIFLDALHGPSDA